MKTLLIVLLPLLTLFQPDLVVESHQSQQSFLWFYTITGDLLSVDDIRITTPNCIITETGSWEGDNGFGYPSRLYIWGGNSHFDWQQNAANWHPQLNYRTEMKFYFLTYVARHPVQGTVYVDGERFPAIVPDCGLIWLPFVISGN